LQLWYRILKQHHVLLPWMPQAIERMDLREFDVIVSSSHAVAKGIVPPSSAIHVCYCHTPMRYAWEMEKQYLEDYRVPHFLQPVIRKQLKHLRRWDLTTSKRVDVFVANSSTTQERIERTYARESIVIPPPVNDGLLSIPLPQNPDRSAFLAVGRLVPYKRFDLLIEAANELKFPLKIAGSGQDTARLKKLAGPTVEILGFVSEEDLYKLYANAKALLFPQIEDAGVVPLESLACGTPVIALGQGGVCDTIEDGNTGVFFQEQTIESLNDALQRFMHMKFDAQALREHARQFSGTRFRERMEEIVVSHAHPARLQSHQQVLPERPLA